jgi:hypothetical protein
MLEKIIKGVYKAKLLKTRLCDVKIIVWGDGQPKTIEQISYAEYDVIKPYWENNLPLLYNNNIA